jgi:hypothetical protein
MTVYNEMYFLPYKKKWCDINGLNLYVIDNMSNDGTWEWLKENKVPSHRIDTHGAFDLRALQYEIVKTVHSIKPDWVIYSGADLYHVSDRKLNIKIKEAQDEGFNMIWLQWFNFFNTGEKFNNNYFDTYYYYHPVKHPAILISKYHSSFKLEADKILRKRKNVKKIEGIMVNYGNCKPVSQREDTLRRRKLAWKRGLLKAWGSHYLVGHEKGWKWNKHELYDIRQTKQFKYIKQLQEWLK